VENEDIKYPISCPVTSLVLDRGSKVKKQERQSSIAAILFQKSCIPYQTLMEIRAVTQLQLN